MRKRRADECFEETSEAEEECSFPQRSSLGLPSIGALEHDETWVIDDRDIYNSLTNPGSLDKEKSLGEPHFSHSFDNFWTQVPNRVNTLTVEEFRIIYKDIKQHHQIGIHNEKIISDKSLCDLKIEEGETLILENNIQYLCKFTCNGLPSCIRTKTWNCILQEVRGDSTEYAHDYCQRLRNQISKHELITDKIILVDEKLCRNDDTFFVFEDILRDVMLYWSRDPWICDNSPCVINMCEDSKIDHSSNSTNNFLSYPTYPPNGVFPFWGISCYAMPICFLHRDSDEAYFIFRQLYVRYFNKLHTINSDPQGLSHLCTTFENLLKQLDPHLFYHLTFKVGSPPLTIAYRWILYAFVGVINIEQVLLLWDRVVGFDRMEIFSAAAVSLFVFRRNWLMLARTASEVEAAFKDLQAIKIMPLIRHLFF
ncbi:hypothetical protein HK098_006054 [Nowakowskiella sp. JEL0407]|nr:hypothetical protein HK098_006054 [Nowakowskiella sp. JEL0407]